MAGGHGTDKVPSEVYYVKGPSGHWFGAYLKPQKGHDNKKYKLIEAEPRLIINKPFELYKEGFVLKENEYLLKIRKSDSNDYPDTGFLTKLNKDDSIPVNFKNWGVGYHDDSDPLPIYKITEDFRPGWELNGWRFGMSRNWAELIHPLGFTVEIYMENFLHLVQDNIIVDGVIQGEFKWSKTGLIKK